LHETVEAALATAGAGRIGDVQEVVHAAVFLDHVHLEALGHAVELGDELGAQGVSAVQRARLLAEHVPVREVQEQVMRERLERHVIAVLSAAAAHRHGGCIRVVPEGEERSVGLDRTPGRRARTDAERELPVAVHLAVELRGSTRRQRQKRDRHKAAESKEEGAHLELKDVNAQAAPPPAS
jgi:hypothetical protein